MCDKNVILIRKVLVLISKQREAGKTAKKKVGGWFWEITDKSFFGHCIYIIFTSYVSSLVYAITNTLEYKGKFCEIGFTI